MKRFLLLILLVITTVNAQNSNDCVNYITVCGSESFVSDPIGYGTKQEVSSCSAFEHNSVWLKIDIIKTGQLGFVITPDDPSLEVDYDFFVYGPNKDCSDLGQAIRCCSTNPLKAELLYNHTGIGGSTLSTRGGPGADGTGYVYWLDVKAGESYFICIDRAVGTGGFRLDWKMPDPTNLSVSIPATGLISGAPIANSIPDYTVCSNTPNVGVFDLDSMRPLINPDSDYATITTNSNEIFIFNSESDAINRTNPLPNIYAMSGLPNPHLVWAMVMNKSTGCYSLTSFNLIVTDCLGINSSVKSNFKAIAYPNPFDNSFVIDISTLSHESLKIKVYDMFGKLIEQMEANPNMIATRRMGQNYSAGIYNVIVIQENEMQTLRVIKK